MSAEAARSEEKPRFFYGWLVVVACFMGDFMMAGVSTHAFGVLLKPMSEELGWTRTMTTFAMTMRSVVSGFSSPIIGPLLDRRGPRVIMVLGATVAGIGVMAQGWVTEIWQFYLVYGVLGSLGMMAMGGLVTSTTVSKWFVRKRGRATAIVMAGLPMGGAVLVPVTQYVVSTYGWRGAWIILGLLVWVLVVPVSALFMRRMPEDMGLRPDGDGDRAVQQKNRSRPVKEERSWTLKEALGTRALWLMIVSFSMGMVSLSATMIHQISYMTDKGFSPVIAATAMPTWAIAAALGTLMWGFMVERVHVRYCVMMAYSLAAVGLVLFVAANSASLPSLFAYAIVHGVAAGGFAPLSSVAYADYYGRTFLGTIRGVVTPIQMLATAGGPIFAGYVYDVTKSYDLAFTVFITLSLLAVFFMFSAAQPRAPEPAAVEVAAKAGGS